MDLEDSYLLLEACIWGDVGVQDLEKETPRIWHRFVAKAVAGGRIATA